VARFLSAEWIKDLDRAASGSERLAGDLAGVTLVVERRVEGSPFGEVAYATRIADGRVRFVAGPAADADLVLVSDYETARALARGELNAQQAFAAGRLKVRGRLDSLVVHARTLAAAVAGVDEVRATTTFDE
jgi:putative sterol carrier protein